MALVVFHIQDAAGHPLAGALITGHGTQLGEWAGQTNACGDFLATLGPDHYELTISHPQAVTRTMGADIAESGVITIGLDRPSAPSGGPSTLPGRLHVVGNGFAGPDGALVRVKPVTAFLAGQLIGQGRSMELNPYAAWTRALVGSLGVPAWRVFGAWSIHGFNPQTIPDYLTTVVDATCRYTLEQGIRLHWVAGTSDAVYGWSSDYIVGLAKDVAAVLAQYDHTELVVWNEYANQPWQHVDPTIFDAVTWPSGLLVAMGRPGTTDLWYAGGRYTHTMVGNRRDVPEWVRYVGHDCGRAFDDLHRPSCVEEPQKFALEVDPHRWEVAAENAAMFNATFVLHGNPESLQVCVVPTVGEQACLEAASAGIDRVPVEAPSWIYTRVGLAPPMPILQGPEDISTIRQYAKISQDGRRAVAIDLHRAILGPANGWRIVSQTGQFAVCER